MLKQFALSLSLVLAAGAAQAQCGNLTASGSGAPGTAVDLAVTGSTANAPVLCVIGDTLGVTTIQIGSLTTLELGLETPFIPVPMGLSDGNGDASLSINVPSTTTMGLDLHGQAVAIDFGFGPGGISLGFCVSNTASFHVGP